MGLEKSKNQVMHGGPSDYEKLRLLALIEVIKNSDLVARVDVVWASELDQMEKSMTTGAPLKALGAK